METPPSTGATGTAYRFMSVLKQGGGLVFYFRLKICAVIELIDDCGTE